MSTPQRSTVEQIFNLYICSVTSEGVKDKTLATYKQHFHAIPKRLDVLMPIASLKSYHLDQMILILSLQHILRTDYCGGGNIQVHRNHVVCDNRCLVRDNPGKNL